MARVISALPVGGSATCTAFVRRTSIRLLAAIDRAVFMWAQYRSHRILEGAKGRLMRMLVDENVSATEASRARGSKTIVIEPLASSVPPRHAAARCRATRRLSARAVPSSRNSSGSTLVRPVERQDRTVDAKPKAG